MFTDPSIRFYNIPQLLTPNYFQEDYELLAEMNRVTTTKYSDMRQIAYKVSKQVTELNSKCK